MLSPHVEQDAAGLSAVGIGDRRVGRAKDRAQGAGTVRQPVLVDDAAEQCGSELHIGRDEIRPAGRVAIEVLDGEVRRAAAAVGERGQE